MVTTHPPKTIVKPTALSPVANTDTKLLIYGLFQKGPSFGTGRGIVKLLKTRLTGPQDDELVSCRERAC